jgi:hypothetical protein
MTNQPGDNRMGRHPILTALMVIFGFILLLPGACAIFFMVAEAGSSGTDSALVGLWIICLLIAFGGVMLIRQALRSPPPRP